MELCNAATTFLASLCNVELITAAFFPLDEADAADLMRKRNVNVASDVSQYVGRGIFEIGTNRCKYR